MTCLASAQLHPHFGIVAGVPLTDTLTSSESGSPAPTSAYFDRFNSKTKRLLIGPAFRLDLIRGFGLEFDALYQRVNSDTTAQSSSPPSFASYSFQQTTANRWQFPLLIQYAHALPRSKTPMFVEFGPSISLFERLFVHRSRRDTGRRDGWRRNRHYDVSPPPSPPVSI